MLHHNGVISFLKIAVSEDRNARALSESKKIIPYLNTAAILELEVWVGEGANPISSISGYCKERLCIHLHTMFGEVLFTGAALHS